ncbi:MAG: acetate--CoA ligase family protein [Hyphomicrobiaceae bacterium]
MSIPTRRPLLDARRLLTPRSVAIIGASSDPVRIGGKPIAYLIERGFRGDIWPVNPNRAEVQGLRAYASVADLPAAPDVAVVAVPASAVVATVSELARRRAGAAIVFSSGFAEVGATGETLQAELLAAAAPGGLRIIGPNTLGVFDVRTGFYGTFMSAFMAGFPKPGRIGIASQSGAYSGHLVSVMRERGLGLASCVMTGNEADVSIADCISVMVADDGIDVITVYAEGIKDGPGFIAALEAARQARKPVIIMKVGRSALGEAAARTHTASIAGSDKVTSAVVAEMGAVRARTTEEMLDIAQLATRRIYPANNSLGALTISGGGGVLIADAAEEAGLAMPPMPPDAQARLKALLPISSPVNPVDCTAQVLNELDKFDAFASSVVEDGGYASILSLVTYMAYAPAFSAKLRAKLKAVVDKHPDRLHVVSIVAANETRLAFEADGLAAYEDPSRAVTAIAAMGRFGAAFARAPVATPPVVPRVTLPASTPSEAEAKRLLATAGIAIAPEAVATSADEALSAAERLGFPVVMKILSPDILHKSEIGGVLLGVATPEAVRAGFATLVKRARAHAPDARIEGVLVAKQLSGGVECILGIQRDPVFGPIAMFGLGGVFVEIMGDVALRRCPFCTDVAEDMIRSIKGAPLLLGARGRPRADGTALAVMLARLSVIAHEAGDRLESIDLNPVIVMPDGQGAFAVDAVIQVRDGA